MSDLLQPDTFDELIGAVESAKTVLPVGRRTKTALSDNSDATLVSLSNLSGIIQYEPSEFTFTAWAGTSIAEVNAALAQRNQYLPFDPLLVDAGATLGGTVAAGISGPGRVRYGGLRDFLLGVRFLSGDGNVITAGGKVVKNAAGFDIPKLLVGSLGRLGLMTELTFKVFPTAPSIRTYRVSCHSDNEAIGRIVIAATSRWELDAIDYRPTDQALFLRLAGPESANQAIAHEIGQRWDCELRTLDSTESNCLWTSIGELTWSRDPGSDIFAKIPITPPQFLSLSPKIHAHEDLACHLSAPARCCGSRPVQ